MPYQYKYTPAGKWPRKKLAKLVGLYLGGRSFEQLQPVFRCTAQTLRTYYYANPVAYEIRKQHPRKHGPRFWTDERHKQLLTMMYGEGKTKQECERFFGGKKLNLYLFYSKEAKRLLKILGLHQKKIQRLKLAGQRFGRLRVVRRALQRPCDKAHTYWICRCTCGRLPVISGMNLTRRVTRSCGNHRATGKDSAGFKHGRWTKKMRYTTCSWYSMLRRCTNPDDHAYENYGLKGVRVCQRMQDFDGFVATVGRRPKDRSLDRINPYFHYSCGECDECLREGWTKNVKWSTDRQQAWNKRCHHTPPTPEEIAHHKEATDVMQQIEEQANELLF